jgi:hypothetical protein
MKRLPDWPQRLAALLDDALNRPFAWWDNDCVTFAAADVEAMTGMTPLQGLSRWENARGAVRALRAEGGFEAAVTARLGSAVSPLLARRGDIVLMPHHAARGRWPGALAVCFGDRCGAPSHDRLVLRPLADAALCWRVGS